MNKPSIYSSLYSTVVFKIILGLVLLQLTLAPSVQLIGWLYMIPTYALQAGSLAQGLEETFSGNKPCCFCKVASDINEEESDQEKQLVKEDKSKKYQPLRRANFSINTNAIYYTDSYRLSVSTGEGFIETPPPKILS